MLGELVVDITNRGEGWLLKHVIQHIVQFCHTSVDVKKSASI